MYCILNVFNSSIKNGQVLKADVFLMSKVGIAIANYREEISRKSLSSVGSSFEVQ